MEKSYNPNHSDSSISDDQEQLNRIKAKLLQNQNRDKKIQEENQKKKRNHIPKKQAQDPNDCQIQTSEIPQYRKINIRAQDRQRSRSREKQITQNIRWHIYQNIGNIDYRDSLDQKLKNLPIFKKKDEILQKILKNQIVLVTGDTGCGKSTQVPRMIYQYLKLIKSDDKIICVQPRRLAVTSLKSSVQNQLRQKSHQLIGYQIGMKAQFNQQKSKIVFMTNGIFLQRIIHDTSFLEKYPFIVLDEVHQRDIDTDFILTALKRIIRQYNKVRIILMSATIDNELFRYYFASDQIDRFMNQQNFYKQIISLQNHLKWKQQQQIQNEFGHKSQDQSEEQQMKKQKIYNQVAFQFMKSKFPCPTININEPSNFQRTYFYLDTMHKFIKDDEYLKKWGAIIFDKKYPNTHKQLYETAWAILNKIKKNNQRNRDKKSQAVLIFLPGLNEIQCLTEQIYKLNGGQQKTDRDYEIIHVHSTIMTEKVQQKINTPNSHKIKVIIATNIAQSSITVRGVKYVIDFCLTKQIHYDLKSRMESLELVWSSKASCKQRAGRTGRVCDGYIFRLVQSNFFEHHFNQYSQPQIKRSSLDKLILRIKMMHQNDKYNLFKNPPEVLGTCIQPPELKSIQSAITSLKFCGGLQQKGYDLEITKLGKLYVQIPIDITYTKLLLISILFGTYQDILILVSILSQSKNPIRKRQMERYPSQYFQQISNYQYCDFIALINLFKKQQESRKDRNFRRQKLQFTLYKQTKNTMDDIQRRLRKKKQWIDLEQIQSSYYASDKYKYSFKTKSAYSPQMKEKYIDYFQRMKLTLAFGFIDKLIMIKQPTYQVKQQKRIKDMKRNNISNDKTIILLNSKQITKPLQNSIEADNKLIQWWKGTFRKSLNVNINSITLTTGLNYLHFENQLDLYKLLFIKYMSTKKLSPGCILDRNQNRNQNSQRSALNTKSNSVILTSKQIFQRIGDLDYMQLGTPVTLYKQQNLVVDHFSINRITDYNQNNSQKYLFSNMFMLQNKHTLSCRYTSQLKLSSVDYRKTTNNNILHVLVNLLFYPFIKLKTDAKNSCYEYLYLRKKYKIKIPYSLESQQIQDANFIRFLLKRFLQLEIPITTQSSKQFYQLVKKFIFKKRKNVIQQKQQLVWQAQFLKENANQIKTQKPQTQKLSQKISNQNQQKKNQNNSTYTQNCVNQSEKKQEQIIQQEIQQGNNHKKQQNSHFNLQQLRNQNNFNQYEHINFMNPIGMSQTSSQGTYFLRSPQQSLKNYQLRIQKYLQWKQKKLNQVKILTEYAEDNDSYLCCKQCGVTNPISKLKRIGPLDELQIFRVLYEPFGIKKSDNDQSSLIDQYLSQQNFHQEYQKICCKNNHQIGIRIKSQQKVKILVFINYIIKYPDNKVQEVDIFSIDFKYWGKKQRQAIQGKQRCLLNTSCFLCSENKIQTLKQLKAHIKDNYHIQNVQKFKKSIQTTRSQLLRSVKCQEQDLEIQEQKNQKKQHYFEKILEQKSQKKVNQEIQIQY